MKADSPVSSSSRDAEPEELYEGDCFAYMGRSVGPAAVASALRRKRKEELERSEKERRRRSATKRECADEEGEGKGEEDAEGRRRRKADPWTSSAIVSM